MNSLYICSVKQQGYPDQLTYHTTRAGAEKHRELLLTNYFANHLRTANRVKGALRGRGRATIMHLASGMVAQEYRVIVRKEYLRGENE